MVRASATIALVVQVGELVVVTGHASGRIEDALDGLPLRTLHHAGAASGMASSLVCGVSALVTDIATEPVGAVIVCLADMPLVRPSTLAALAAAWRADARVHAVVPMHAGKRGNPVLLGRARFDHVLSLSGDKGARALLHGDGVRELAVDDPGVLIDHDTPESLARLDRESGAG